MPSRSRYQRDCKAHVYDLANKFGIRSPISGGAITIPRGSGTASRVGLGTIMMPENPP